MIIIIANTAKKSISFILSIMIDPCAKVNKTRLVRFNIHSFDSDLKNPLSPDRAKFRNSIYGNYVMPMVSQRKSKIICGFSFAITL